MDTTVTAAAALGRIDVNTLKSSASKKMDTAAAKASNFFSSGREHVRSNVSGRSGRISSSRKGINKKLSKSLPDTTTTDQSAYDFASITDNGAGTTSNRRSVSEPVLAPYVDDGAADARDDVDEILLERNKLPTAITTDYYSKAEHLGLAHTSSIFRTGSTTSSSNNDSSGRDGADDTMIPIIQRANPIVDFDIDRYYTIHFGPEEEEDAAAAAATTTLCSSTRLEVDESVGYVIPQPQDEQTANSSKVPCPPSIFRILDNTVESVIDSMLCLQRANAVLDDEEDAEDYEKHDLELSESDNDNRMYYHPESMWNKENNPDTDMLVSSDSRLVPDEVEGYVISDQMTIETEEVEVSGFLV